MNEHLSLKIKNRWVNLVSIGNLYKVMTVMRKYKVLYIFKVDTYKAGSTPTLVTSKVELDLNI